MFNNSPHYTERLLASSLIKSPNTTSGAWYVLRKHFLKECIKPTWENKRELSKERLLKKKFINFSVLKENCMN